LTDLSKTPLDFARWLQSIEMQMIGEDVDLDHLYEQWNGDQRCNHDPAALTMVEIYRCECGAVLFPATTCSHCGEEIEPNLDNDWVHTESGFAGCGDLPGEESQDPLDPNSASLAEQGELYAEP
jgi:hypothetical protein